MDTFQWAERKDDTIPTDIKQYFNVFHPEAERRLYFVQSRQISGTFSKRSKET